MNGITRRLAVRGIGLAAAVALAGCLDGGGRGDGSGDGPEYEVHQVGATSADRAWSGRDDAAGAVELYRSRGAAAGRFEGGLLEGVPEDRRRAAREFLDATDFDRSVLLYIASEGPDSCYGAVEVRDLSLSDGTLTGTAVAKDTGEPGAGCADVITYPAALVRATADPRPDRAELTVVNGWGDESALVATGPN